MWRSPFTNDSVQLMRAMAALYSSNEKMLQLMEKQQIERTKSWEVVLYVENQHQERNMMELGINSLKGRIDVLIAGAGCDESHKPAYWECISALQQELLDKIVSKACLPPPGSVMR